MSPFKIIVAATAVALVAAPALASTKYQSSTRRTEKERIVRARTAGEYARESSAIIPLSSPTPPSRAHLLTPDDPYVVTNGPVPDTRGNRARFGGPMSRGGRMTAPVGD